MKSSTSNPVIDSIINAVNPKAKPVPKGKSKAPAVIPDFQLVELGAEIGGAYLGFISASEALESVRIKIVKTGFKPIDLRKAKSDPEGARQTKIFKGAFIDSVIASGKKPAVAQNYFEIVAKGLTSDKPITSTNPSMAKGKAKSDTQKSKGGEDNTAKMVGALLNVWKLSDVATESLTYVEGKIDDGMTLIEAIADYLESEGVDLKGGDDSE